MIKRILHKIKLFWIYDGPFTSHYGLTKILWCIKFYNFRHNKEIDDLSKRFFQTTSVSYHWSLYIFWLNITLYATNDQGWIRIAGRGFVWKDITKVPLLFSERNGLKKTFRIGKYSLKYLTVRRQIMNVT